jgi:NADPH:quinone reductase-like Zn-dependent oxidoreductase
MLSIILSPDRHNIASTKNKMKAVVTTGNGGYDKLEYRDVPVPEISSGKVLLKVLAAGMDNIEINTRLRRRL